jgi:hypothetical protein
MEDYVFRLDKSIQSKPYLYPITDPEFESCHEATHHIHCPCGWHISSLAFGRLVCSTSTHPLFNNPQCKAEFSEITCDLLCIATNVPID